MTEITNYRCDICGEVYVDQESAERCEAFHVSPAELKSMFFGSVVKTNIPYPGFLMMQMADGGIVKYAYNDIINVPKQEENDSNVIVEPEDPTSGPADPASDPAENPTGDPAENNGEGDGE